MRGRGLFLQKSPLPRAPSSKDESWENSGGGGFSKRSPSPGPPPEEWLEFELVFSPNYMPLLVGRGFLFLGCGHGG